MSEIAQNETKFFEWLTKSSLSDEKGLIGRSYKNVNLLLVNNHLVQKTVFEIDSEEELSTLLGKVRRSFNNKKNSLCSFSTDYSLYGFSKRGKWQKKFERFCK